MTRGDGDALVLPDLEAREADQVLSALAAHAAPALAGLSAAELAQRFTARERLGSTAIGGGVAMPHCRCAEVDRPLLLLARAPHGVPFGADDGLPVRLFVAIVTPEGSPAQHLTALAQLSRRLREAKRVAELLAARDAASVLAAWRRSPGEAA